MGSRLKASIALLIATTSLALLALTPGAAAKPLDPCRGIHAKGQLYGVGGKHVKCGFARHWAKLYLKHGREPRGWSCFGRSFEVGNCHKLQGDSLFQFYTQD
jgi:hypothetical protein